MLVAAEAGPDLAMQRLLRRAGRPVFGPPPALEINANHGLIAQLATQDDVQDMADLLLDLAKLQDGELPEDPSAFVHQISIMLGNK